MQNPFISSSVLKYPGVRHRFKKPVAWGAGPQLAEASK